MYVRPIRPLLGALLACAIVACADDLPMQPGGPDAPQLDHTTGEPPSVVVDVNNYELLMSPNEIFDGIYKDQYVFFAGQVGYGTDGSHVYFYDTRGRTNSFVEAGTSPFVEVGGSVADHYTAALLFESDDQRGGERQHLDIVTVRESFAFTAAPDDDYVIVRYTLTNPTDEDVVDAHLGFFADPDVLAAGNNSTVFDASLQAAVTHNPDHAVRSAYVLLDRSVAHYQHWVNPGAQLGADVSDPDSYVGWFELLSGAGDAGSLEFFDVRNALTTDPVVIPAHGSETLTVALVAGDDDADLAANVAAARARFAGMTIPTPTVRAVPIAITAGDAVYTAVITFPDASLATAFVAADAACGKAPVTVTSASGAIVSVEFDRLAIDPTLVSGNRLYCTGRLADGTFFSGHDTPDLPYSRIHLVSVTSGPEEDWQPTWSPDGHTVAFSSTRSGVPAIWILDTADPAATPQQLTDGEGNGEGPFDGEAHPDWSPDGEHILFVREGGVFEIEVATGVERQLTATQDESDVRKTDQDARYSPDGSAIVVWRSSHVGDNLWVMPVAGELGGAVATRVTDGFSNIYPDWAAADGLIYYTNQLSGSSWAVFSVDPDVGPSSVTRVSPDEPSINRHPSLSPDGRTLAFSDHRLILQDMTLGRHTIVLLEPEMFLGQSSVRQNVEFSPDGTRVIFASEDGDIWYANLSQVTDPVARAEGLSSSVQSLIDSGLLDAAGGATLIASLEDITTKLENGQLGAALNKVNAYINQVNALINSRRVGAIEGQQLIDGGNALADQIDG